MPIVDLAPQPLTAITGRPEGFAVTPGKDELDHGSDTPDFGRYPRLAGADTPDVGGPDSVLGAAFRQGNIIGSSIARQDQGVGYGARDPSFNPWDAIKGTKYEPHWDKFVDTFNPAEADARKRQIDMEDEDRRTLAGAPWYKSFPAQLLAGAADIPSLLPGGAFVRGAKGGISVAGSAAVTGAAAGVGVGLQEAVLHGTQQTRTFGESAMNIGASVFLSGLLGAAGAKFLSRAEWNRSIDLLNRDLGRSEPPAGFTAYHASPHDFDAFDIGKLGAGEGAQVYARGLYFAENPDVSGPGGFYEQMFKGARGEATSYRVRILANKEDLLDWDRPLSEQPAKVRKLVDDAGLKEKIETGENTGAGIYKALEDHQLEQLMSEHVKQHGEESYPDSVAVARALEEFPQKLRESGIPGVKYLDAGSRNAGEGTRNFVVFHHENVQITHKNGTPIAPPETIRSAAIKFRGHVYEGDVHVTAVENAAKKLGISVEDLIDEANAHVGAKEALSDLKGFVTSTGRYIDREEARKIAERNDLLSDFAKTESKSTLSMEEIALEHRPGFGQPSIDRAIGGAPASAGAAAVEAPTLEGNRIAGRTARALAAVTRPLNPFMRVMQSPAATSRSTIQRLAEFAGYTDGNFAERASPKAAETAIKRWQGALTVGIEDSNKIYEDYWKSGGGSKVGLKFSEWGVSAPPGILKPDEFRDAVGKAMRREDKSDNPYVAKAAGNWRKLVVEPLKDEAIKMGLLPEDVNVAFAPSYFSRMWNRNRIIGEEDRFKGLVTEFMNDHIIKEYDTATAATKGRLQKLDQEIMDLTLSPEGRTEQLGKVEAALAAHEEAGDAYLGLTEKADRLGELDAEMRRAKNAKDKAAYQTAKSEKDTIIEQGGEALKDFRTERAALRKRRSDIDLGAAGLAERSQQIMENLANLEEDTQRSLGRLVKKGQKLERELDKLDPDVLAERISALKDNFAAIAQRSDAAADRAAKAIADMKETAAKRAAKAGEEAQVAGANVVHGNPEEAAANRAAAKAAREKANAALEEAEAKVTARLEKEAATQRARSERMTKIADRLAVAEGFDREGAVAELRAGIEKAIAEASDTALARGERAQRMLERVAALDPQRIKDRVATVEQMKKDIQRAYYDRWETKRLGENIDLYAPNARRPDFSEYAKEIAEHIYNTFTGRAEEAGIRPEFAPVTTRGPMKERTLPIPDLYVSPQFGAIEDFLTHDVEEVMKRYTRVMGADVEVQRQFGSLDLKDEMAAIHRNYDGLRAEAPDEKARIALSEAEKADKRDITETLNNIRGTRAPHAWEQGNWGAIVRSANHFEYILHMGHTTLNSLQDAVRPAMVHGLMPYMRTIGQLATNLQAIKLQVRDGKLMGNIAETVNSARLSTIADLGDPMARRGPIESFMANMTDLASKWNGIRLWTDWMKSIASAMTQNRLLENAMNFAKLDKSESAYMHFLGIDAGMAERIAARFEAHGQELRGVKWANIAEWGKTDAAARDAFAAAMNKDVDSIIVIPSKADVPLLAHRPEGKILLQFKSFTLASHQRVMLRGLQEKPSRFIGGAVAMSALGMLQVYLAALSGNRTSELRNMADDPGWWLGEAIDKASFLPVFMEASNDFEKFTTMNPVKAPLKVFDKGAAESQKVQGAQPISVLGPMVGSAVDLGTVLSMGANIKEGKPIRKGQVNAAERLMPFNSYLGIREAMKYLFNPPH
jgi:hypothetical protein